MKKLILVESPAKCNKILSFLDASYSCEATFGHLRELTSLKNIHSDFEIEFTNIAEKQRQIDKLSKKIKNVDEVIVATDDDREGEGIAWHVLQLFNLPLTTKRIKFNSITKEAVLNALQNPGTIDMQMVESQQTRQVLDLFVGFKISPVLWSGISRKSGLSAGRCQTPALHILYENHQKNKTLEQDQFYNVHGYFTGKNIKFSLNTSFSDEPELLNFLKICYKQPSFPVHQDIKEGIKKQPPKPFITSSLQQTCSSLFNMSPKDCMSVCQKLYEAGHITYMRTDSYFLSDKFKSECGQYINEKHGEVYMNTSFVSADKKNAQQAHEAIRPTYVDTIPQLSGKEEKVYALIRKRTIQSLMTEAVINTHKFSAVVNDTYSFVLTRDLIVFKGWMILEKEEEESHISYLSNLQKVPVNKIVGEPSFRNTSLHYTEAKLIKELEDKNIGRPSTFASIVEKLKERKYVVKGNIEGNSVQTTAYEISGGNITKQKIQKVVGAEKSKLIIQPLGITVIEILIKHFNSLFQYDFTEEMEHSLDLIATGNATKMKVAKNFTDTIDTLLTKYSKVGKSKIMIDDKHEFIISKNGPVLKSEEGGKTIFKKIKSNVDMDRIKNGSYMLDELLDNSITERILGNYKDIDVLLKTGKYGLYVEYNGKKTSIKCVDKHFDDVLLADVIDLLDGNSQDDNDNRIITNEISIRKGKFGHYIFYKTSKMTRPKFINLKDINDDYMNCDKEIIIRYVENNI